MFKFCIHEIAEHFLPRAWLHHNSPAHNWIVSFETLGRLVNYGTIHIAVLLLHLAVLN